MRIGQRTALGFAVMMVLTAVVGAVGWFGLERFAASVERSAGIAAIADATARAISTIDAYQVSRDSDLSDSAAQQLEAAHDDAVAAGLERVAEDLERASAAFGELVQTSALTEGLHTGLTRVLQAMEAEAEAIRAHEREHYAEVNAESDAAIEDQNRRVASARLAEQLARAALDARFSGVQYRMHGNDGDRKTAEKALATMAKVADTMVKTNTAPKEARIYDRLASGVTDYRGVVEAALAAPGNAEAQTAFDKESAKVNRSAVVIADMQHGLRQTALAKLMAAKSALAGAVESTNAATQALADIRQLRELQGALFDGDADAPARLAAALDVIDADRTALAAAATEPATHERLTTLTSHIQAYRDRLSNAQALLVGAVARDTAIHEAAADVRLATQGEVDAVAQARAREGELARMLILGGTALALLVGLGVAILLGRSLTVPIRRTDRKSVV